MIGDEQLWSVTLKFILNKTFLHQQHTRRSIQNRFIYKEDFEQQQQSNEMKSKSHKTTSCQGQILEVFQTVSSGTGGDEGTNGWHLPVIRSQGGKNPSVTLKPQPSNGMNLQKCSHILRISNCSSCSSCENSRFLFYIKYNLCPSVNVSDITYLVCQQLLATGWCPSGCFSPLSGDHCIPSCSPLHSLPGMLLSCWAPGDKKQRRISARKQYVVTFSPL